MKRKKVILGVAALVLTVCLVPIKAPRKANETAAVTEEMRGTVEYSAILYKVIVWDDMYLERPYDGAFTKRKGTDFYFFPFNFGTKDWHS